MLDHCPLLADRDGHFGHLCPISSCSWQSPPSPSNADHVTATRSHFTSAHPDLHVCPIQTCDWYTSTADPDEIKDVVRTHLVQIHENLQCMNAISDDTFAMYDLHPCQTCNSPRKIYCTLGHLRRHQNIHTPPARPDNKSNSQLIHDTFQTLPLLPNHWPRSLQWLNTHELEPPPFRESSWRKCSGRTKQSVLSTYGLLLQLACNSSASAPQTSNEPLPIWETSSAPFWKLLLLFQPLVLQPQRSTSNLNSNVRSRLRLFAAGHLEELYFKMITRPPSKLQRKITVDDLDDSELLYSQLLDANDSPKFNPAAQSAADLDNLHSAFQHLDSSHPVAINTDEAMAYVKSKLFPDPPTNNNFPLPAEKATSPPGFRQNLLPDDDKFILAIRRIKTGTASGPFADSPELFRAFALTPSQRYGPDKEITYPNLPLARAFLNVLHNAELPDDVLPAFNALYFLALQKKSACVQSLLELA